MGNPTMHNNPTLIPECTHAACSKWGTRYETVGEYMWVMLEDGMLPKEEARNEYVAALHWQCEREAWDMGIPC